jgi:hypothetical protein
VDTIINLAVQGNNNLSSDIFTNTFTPTAKLEWQGVISGVNGFVSLPVPTTSISFPSYLIGYAQGSYKVQLNDNQTVSGVNTYKASGVLYVQLDPNYSRYITSISVGTDSVTGLPIQLSILTV